MTRSLVAPPDLAHRLVGLRRELHRYPEVGLRLPETQRRVTAALQDLPLELGRGSSSDSLTAVIRGRRSDRSVLLRADMDALPVREQTGLAYSSEIADVMHACGHDLHTAMLVGAAELLCDRRDHLDGDVVLMFQPGEEGWEGARAMLAEGVLDASGVRVGAAYALHVFSNLPAGQVRTRAGAVLAASAELDVLITGTGGHASAPHLARDPVPAAAEMMLALQRAAGRDLDAHDPAVLSIGVMRAGEWPNVISDTAHFVADVRTLSVTAQQRVEQLADRVCSGIAAAHGVDVTVRFTPLRPATVNDPAEADLALRTARELFGPDRVSVSTAPEHGSEDFARVLAEVPGCFISLGAMPDGIDPSAVVYNHTPTAEFDDGVLLDGARLLAELAVRRLGSDPTDGTRS